MLSQDLIKAALQKALSTGADYAEVFAEHTDSKTISMVSSKVDKIEDAVISGVGIRIFKGLRCVSGSTSSLLPEAVLACAERVAGVLNDTPIISNVNLTERIFGDIHPIKVVPVSVANSTKIDYLREAYNAAKEYNEGISLRTDRFVQE